MLDLMLSTWLYALVATTLLFAVVVGGQGTLRWVRGRRRTAATVLGPAEPLTQPHEERVTAGA